MREKCLSMILAAVMLAAMVMGCSKSENEIASDIPSVTLEESEVTQEASEPEEEVIEEVVEEIEEVQPFVPGKWEGGINRVTSYLPYEVVAEWEGSGEWEFLYEKCIDKDNFELIVEPEELLETISEAYDYASTQSARIKDLGDDCIEIGINIKGLGSVGDRFVVKEMNGKYKIIEEEMASNYEGEYDYIDKLTCEYDDEGKIISQIVKHEDNENRSKYHSVATITYEYDGDTVIKKTKTYENDGTMYGEENYDCEYDNNGNVIKQTKTYEYSEDAGEEAHITKETNTYEYDDNGELVKNTYICEAGADSHGYEWSIEMLNFPNTVEHPLISREMHFPDENVPGTEIVCKITLKEFDGMEVPEDASCLSINEKECTFVFEEK